MPIVSVSISCCAPHRWILLFVSSAAVLNVFFPGIELSCITILMITTIFESAKIAHTTEWFCIFTRVYYLINKIVLWSDFLNYFYRRFRSTAFLGRLRKTMRRGSFKYNWQLIILDHGAHVDILFSV